MKIIKLLLPRRICGYSKHTPKPIPYKEGYFDDRLCPKSNNSINKKFLENLKRIFIK